MNTPADSIAHGRMSGLSADAVRLLAQAGEHLERRDVTRAIPLVEGARDPEHLAMIRTLGIKSVICVPMTARDRVLGVITFVSSSEERHFGAQDLGMALEIARRAAELFPGDGQQQPLHIFLGELGIRQRDLHFAIGVDLGQEMQHLGPIRKLIAFLRQRKHSVRVGPGDGGNFCHGENHKCTGKSYQCFF